MIISGVVFVISLINSIKNKTGLFKYSFEYYDENGKFLYEEECTKEEYYASPKKEIISQSSRTKSMWVILKLKIALIKPFN